jgi:hypothetical protein
MRWWRHAAPLALITLFGSLLTTSLSASTDRLPTRAGECRQSRIVQIATRWGETLTYDQEDSSSGSLVRFSNGGIQMTFFKVRELFRSRVRDRVRICLVKVLEDCPPGDDRGRSYRTTNLRTGESWTLPDDTRMCGGA